MNKILDYGIDLYMNYVYYYSICKSFYYFLLILFGIYYISIYNPIENFKIKIFKLGLNICILYINYQTYYEILFGTTIYTYYIRPIIIFYILNKYYKLIYLLKYTNNVIKIFYTIFKYNLFQSEKIDQVLEVIILRYKHIKPVVLFLHFYIKFRINKEMKNLHKNKSNIIFDIPIAA